MEFCKYQGAGNDFVIVDNMDLKLKDKNELAARMCDRRFGVGADGFIAAEPSETSDVKMAFYNSDGSIAGMCGNGIRCFSKFVTDMEIINADHFTVETGDGQKTIDILGRTPLETTVKVDMGKYGAMNDVICIVPTSGMPALTSETAASASDASSTSGSQSSRSFDVVSTHIGVPHAVIFCDTSGDGMPALDVLAETYGRDIEFAPEFAPAKTNVNFVEVIDKGHILCSTWERGAGKTLACGTGACSSAAAAHICRECNDSIIVTMPGGQVTVSFDADKNVYMEGSAVLTFTGETAE